MRKLKNEIKIDGFKESVENALGMEAKRKTKEMAATTGIATIYGLLFANLVFAPLLPHLAAQSNSPTNNSPTNSVPIPTDHPIGLGDFDNARSEADCLKILKEKARVRWDEYKDAAEAAQAAWDLCMTNRNNSLRLNEANHQAALNAARTASSSIFWGCLGIGTGATTVTIQGTGQIFRMVKGVAVAVGRTASGIAGAVVGIGSFVACRSLSNNHLARAIDNANEIKRIQDETTWSVYGQCYDANYLPLLNKANRLNRKYFRNYKS